MVLISINLRLQECMRYLDKSSHNACGLWEHSICMTSPPGFHVLSQQLCLLREQSHRCSQLCVRRTGGPEKGGRCHFSFFPCFFSVVNSVLKRVSKFPTSRYAAFSHCDPQWQRMRTLPEKSKVSFLTTRRHKGSSGPGENTGKI